MENRIKELRKLLNLNQTEFSRALNVTPAAISKIEAGTRPLTDRMIHNIANEFGVDENWLRTGEGDPFPLPSQEDTDLIDILSEFSADDMDPRKKRAITEVGRILLALPPEMVETVYEVFSRMAEALRNEKKDED